MAALVDRCPSVGIEIVRRVIADADSPLTQVTGVTLSAIRVADAERALELAQALVDTGLTAARMSVAYAYGWGLASAPAVSTAELALIMDLAADVNVEVGPPALASGCVSWRNEIRGMALMVILEMRIGRREQLAGEVLRAFCG